MVSMLMYFTCHILEEQLDTFIESDMTKNTLDNFLS
jgi:hypothetical protein